jgi:hypothetical protein
MPRRVAIRWSVFVRRLLALLPLCLIAGCAGYAADYWKSKDSLIATQLPRYGLTGEQGQCVQARLTKNLSVWQLRQLGDLARRLVPSGGSATLGPRDLAYVAGLVQDPAVGPEVAASLDSCGARSGAAPVSAAAPAATPEPGTSPSAQPLRWIELGKADTGQGIAVDITSVVTTGEQREGWFRLSNPGEPAAQPVAYRLRIDCAAKTITPTGARRYDPEGKVAHQEDYGKDWQEPLPIEAGTVMEIAHRSVCR